ncbi:hypothetical protein DM02DRAFT_523977 [Periconia macrospinosa]|uniref:Uncharacterized protein n=1 Tax=Periconia macrospinosa TaxID=97972 RepID=A0A2V1DU82_9PLEO|nr:hypothetical protein DM02DRAFT_523977 [Periconia macrospinosa]
MSIFPKPLHFLGPPFLLVVSVPLAVFACVTTTVALSLLAVRVSVVYFELGVALLHAYVFPENPKKLHKRHAAPATPSPPRTRHRRSSSSSLETVVPPARIHTKSGSSASLLGSGDLTRDYEGVGGWRFYDGEEEEALWMGLNKRLELPIATPRRHQRRHTGEDRWSWSPEVTRMSPFQSRARTPTRPMTPGEGDEYFPIQPSLRPLSTATEPLSRSAHHSRRTSIVDIQPPIADSQRNSAVYRPTGE